MSFKVLSTKKFSLIFYPTFYLITFVIGLIIGFFYSMNFFYSYLINSIFIIMTIGLVLSLDRYLLINFLKRKENLLVKQKITFVLFWKIKWIPAILLLVSSIILTNEKIIFINNFGLMYGAIILIIILVISEILKLIHMRYLDLD